MKKALSGLRAWLVQRVTAVYMLLFCVAALLRLALGRPHSYDEWRGWLAAPLTRTATALFFAALLLHAWVGLRDVMMDYVRTLALRVTLLALLAFALGGMALWLVRILLLTPA